jgi:hypothetical protein
MAPHPSGGAYITWLDERTEITTRDVYIQRLDTTGVKVWASQGVAVCTASGDQADQMIVKLATGEAVVAWRDSRAGNYDVYMQKVDITGTMLWTADGVAVSASPGDELDPYLTATSDGGFIVSWTDERAGNRDIYAQKYDGGGNPQWTTDGVAVCTAALEQTSAVLVDDGDLGAVVAWRDGRGGNKDIYAQAIRKAGNHAWYHMPVIHSVVDIPGDQGGYVYLSWYASYLDDVSQGGQISEYTLWRAMDPAAAMAMVSSGDATLLATEGGLSVPPARAGLSMPSADGVPLAGAVPVGRVFRSELVGATTYFWEYIETYPAYYFPAYGRQLPTFFDSTAVSDDYNYFQVVAHTSDPFVFYSSFPDSGQSVDNLAPAAPAGFVVAYNSGIGNLLNWESCADADFQVFKIYRGTTPDFVPAPGNEVAATADTLWTDPEYDGWAVYYRITAVDHNGNESDPASPATATGIGRGIPERFALHQNVPNPFNPTTVIGYEVPEGGGPVTLRIYDVSGRLVRTLVDGIEPPGEKRVVWYGRNDDGGRVATGVYFYRMTAPEFEATRKMILLQ